MAKYRKKPVVVDAEQWFGHAGPSSGFDVVGRYDKYPQDRKCEHCGVEMRYHGWVRTLEGGHIACPEDWIIKGIEGEFYPCKPDIFEKTYELVED